MKKYFVFVNCTSFMTFEITAKSKADAEAEALKHFQCDSRQGEVVREDTRLWEPDDYANEDHDVYYPPKGATK